MANCSKLNGFICVLPQLHSSYEVCGLRRRFIRNTAHAYQSISAMTKLVCARLHAFVSMGISCHELI